MEKKSNNSLESWKKSISNYNKCIYSFTHSTEIYEAVLRWQACVRKCIRVCETFAAGSHPVPNVSGLNMSLFFRSQTYSRLFLGREGRKHHCSFSRSDAAESRLCYVWNAGGHWSRGRERREISFLPCFGPEMVHITSAYSPILELVT